VTKNRPVSNQSKESSENEVLQSLVAQQSITWHGPLPPPVALAQYNSAFPGCAERIVKQAEEQSRHRQNLEQLTINANIASQDRGQWMAFTLALLILVGGFALIFFEKSVLGTVFIGTDIAATVGIFLYGKHDQRRQLAERRAALQSAERAVIEPRSGV
jgi:uncharacterized membrane protein